MRVGIFKPQVPNSQLKSTCDTENQMSPLTCTGTLAAVAMSMHLWSWQTLPGQLLRRLHSPAPQTAKYRRDSCT